MNSKPEARQLKCQLCNRQGLKKFEVEGSCTLWLCEPCELYQYGNKVHDSAYAAEYHAGYENKRGRKIRTARVRLNRVVSLFGPLASGKKLDLLEVGCSVGTTLEAARFLPLEAVGVDVSTDAVAYCQQRKLQASCVAGFELPFESESFDLIVSWHVIEHVQDVRKTLGEWRRVLKPGGYVYVETPDAASPKVRKLGTSYRKFWAPEHTYTFTYQNLASFFREEGMEVVAGPIVGDLRNHRFSFAPYAIGYQIFQGIKLMTGLQKEFQIFARKPVDETTPEVQKAACVV